MTITGEFASVILALVFTFESVFFLHPILNYTMVLLIVLLPHEFFLALICRQCSEALHFTYTKLSHHQNRLSPKRRPQCPCFGNPGDGGNNINKPAKWSDLTDRSVRMLFFEISHLDITKTNVIPVCIFTPWVRSNWWWRNFSCFVSASVSLFTW